MLDNCRLVVVSPSAVGPVLFESGGKTPTSLANIHFAALARDLVNARSVGHYIKGKKLVMDSYNM